jgi:hypothetical protein
VNLPNVCPEEVERKLGALFCVKHSGKATALGMRNNGLDSGGFNVQGKQLSGEKVNSVFYHMTKLVSFHIVDL